MRIFFSVGEPSGDVHGSNLIRRLQVLGPDVECVGYGGPKMAAAGCGLHEDLTRLAVMGVSRVVMHLGRFLLLVRRADRYFRAQRPDAVVLIDYPGFNWWIARRAKAHGIPVFYYGVPQIWAWGRWRVKKLRRLTDHVLCQLPFEASWFSARGCRANYVGHPFFDQLAQQVLDEEFVNSQRDQGGPLVTILPGSRTQEVTSNLAIFLNAAQLVSRNVPSARFVIASYNVRQAKIAEDMVARAGMPVKVLIDRTQELMQLATCCMACSGSVSLELLYRTKPTVIHYRVSRGMYHIGRRLLLKIKYITLVNLLAADDPFTDRSVPFDPDGPDAEQVLFPEYATCEDKSAQVAAHVTGWLTDESARTRLVERLGALRDQVCRTGASQKAAEYILHHVEYREKKEKNVPRPNFLPSNRATIKSNAE